jgi:hypothetical protein
MYSASFQRHTTGMLLGFPTWPVVNNRACYLLGNNSNLASLPMSKMG